VPVTTGACRHLVLILGDQLAFDSRALTGFDPACDRVLMIEAPEESTHVRSHRARIALFLSAMRHFRDALRGRGWSVDHIELDDPDHRAQPGLPQRLASALARHRPELLRLAEPGEWRLQQAIEQVARQHGTPLDVVSDAHFLCTRAEFAAWAAKYRKSPTSSLRMEFFYREMRRRYRVLIDAKDPSVTQPEGGQWNFDAENRKGYSKSGPGLIPPHEMFEPDALTRDVLALVDRRFADHPGDLTHFAWPVDRRQALQAMEVFVNHRLPGFGDHQDAMWTDTPFGWHSLLSTSLNLHLLDPREVIAAAEDAYRRGHAPLAAVEGFIRQILGWREFIRGVYWLDMPGLAEANHYGHRRALPVWFWTGETRMACARDAIGQTLKHGYAHHIQRLMVTGLFGLLAEIDPREVSAWYLAVYVDAVEWVELPNVVGMALFADGGRFTSKPYVASGAYIDRMSNYCDGCSYAPDRKSSESKSKPLCPYTVLYWNFLDQHEAELSANPRTSLMAKNVARLDSDQRLRIREAAQRVLEDLDDL